MSGGDTKVAGIAVELPSAGSHVFLLGIHEVVHTAVENDQLVIWWWTPRCGLRETRRT